MSPVTQNVEIYVIEGKIVLLGVTGMMEDVIYSRIIILFPPLRMIEVGGLLEGKPAETVPSRLLTIQLMKLQ